MTKQQISYKQTEIGEIPSDWKVGVLGNDFKINTGKGTKRFKSGLYPIEGGTKTIGYTNDFLVDGSSILTGRVGTLGSIRMKKGRCWISDNTIYLQANNSLELKFLYYFLQLNNFKNLNIGSTQPLIKQSDIKKIYYPLPPMTEKRNIVSILSSLDDKIKLNRKMNKTLEEIGKALFKHWFVDFEFPNEEGGPYKSSGGEMVDSELGKIPKGWEVGKLKDLIEITSGKRPKIKVDDKTEDHSVPIIGASGVMGYTSDILYNERIIVTGRVGTLGIVQKINYPCWMSDNALVIKSEYYEYIYGALSLLEFSSLNVGSTQPLITQTALKSIDIIIPQKSILLMFEESIRCLTSKMKKNNIENKLLKGIRDSLLPRLMTGRLRVC